MPNGRQKSFAPVGTTPYLININAVVLASECCSPQPNWEREEGERGGGANKKMDWIIC
jgi:hypothetical protein